MLLAYTDFGKKYFTKGLPDPEEGRLPLNLTNIDMADLKSFLSREVLTETQFKLGFVKNLDEMAWVETNERDFDGK